MRPPRLTKRNALSSVCTVLDALLERAGADAPLGVGVAPPGAGAGARRVDQHQIAPPVEVGEHVGSAFRRPYLDIARRPSGRAWAKIGARRCASGSAA